MQENDATHVELVNTLLRTMNDLNARGASIQYIASAALAAAAAYTVFSHQVDDVPLTRAQLDAMARQFRGRMIEFIDHAPPPPRTGLINPSIEET